jgi:hypothetical protein
VLLGSCSATGTTSKLYSYTNGNIWSDNTNTLFTNLRVLDVLTIKRRCKLAINQSIWTNANKTKSVRRHECIFYALAPDDQWHVIPRSVRRIRNRVSSRLSVSPHRHLGPLGETLIGFDLGLSCVLSHVISDLCQWRLCHMERMAACELVIAYVVLRTSHNLKAAATDDHRTERFCVKEIITVSQQ